MTSLIHFLSTERRGRTLGYRKDKNTTTTTLQEIFTTILTTTIATFTSTITTTSGTTTTTSARPQDYKEQQEHTNTNNGMTQNTFIPMDTDDIDLDGGSDIDSDFDDKTTTRLLHDDNDNTTVSTRQKTTKSLTTINSPLTTNDSQRPTTFPKPFSPITTSKITTTSSPMTTYPTPVVTTSSTMTTHPIPVVTTNTRTYQLPPPTAGPYHFCPPPPPAPPSTHSTTSTKYSTDIPSARNILQTLSGHMHSIFYHNQQEHNLQVAIDNSSPPPYTRPTLNTRLYDDLPTKLKTQWDTATTDYQLAITKILRDYHKAQAKDIHDTHITFTNDMIQKAYNDTEFTLQLNTKAKQEAADKLIRKRPRTDHPRHRHDNRRNDRSTDRRDSRGEDRRFNKDTRPKDRNGRN